MAKSTTIRRSSVERIDTTTARQGSDSTTPEPARDARITLLRAAVEQQDRNQSPIAWAEAKFDLGDTLLKFAMREQFDEYKDALLSEAISVFKEALEEKTHARDPFYWGMTKGLLGSALEIRSHHARKQGLTEEYKTLLLQAIQEYRDMTAETNLLKTSSLTWEAGRSCLARTLEEYVNAQDTKDAFREAMNVYQTLYLGLNVTQLVSRSPTAPDGSGEIKSLVETRRDKTNIRRGIESIKTVRDKSIITRNGVRYLPLPRAAAIAQASESAVKKWITNRTKFGGRAIETYTSITKDIYVGDESAKKMAQRFVSWPSNKPVGAVILGETDDQSGFIGLTDAARILHVGHHTMWLWVTQDKAPSLKSLDVIKCTVSDYLYIREKDLLELKSAIPRSGLRRGRRPRETAQPS